MTGGEFARRGGGGIVSSPRIVGEARELLRSRLYWKGARGGAPFLARRCGGVASGRPAQIGRHGLADDHRQRLVEGHDFLMIVAAEAADRHAALFGFAFADDEQ